VDGKEEEKSTLKELQEHFHIQENDPYYEIFEKRRTDMQKHPCKKYDNCVPTFASVLGNICNFFPNNSPT
jgi:hypothetical protein